MPHSYFRVCSRNGKSITHFDVHIALGRWYGKRQGLKGNRGGWIFRIEDGKPIAQGWEAVYRKFHAQIWAELNRKER